MGIHKGTKLTDKPKDKTIKIRLDEQTDQELSFLSNTLNQSKAQIIRNGISEQYKKIKK